MHQPRNTDKENQKALQLACNLMGMRHHSRYELLEKLRKKGFSDEAAERSTRHLEELQLLDDLEFSRAFIRSRCRTRPSGSYKLRYELRNKGIEDAIIDQALNEFNSKEECLKAAEKKLPHLKGERHTRARKLHSHLVSRGFSSEEIREALCSLIDQDNA